MADKKLDFIIIPNKVKLRKNLTAGAKILMGEIIALCSKRGYCWASNQYLAEIFDVDRMTISVWVTSLRKNGFIKCKSMKYNKRRIFIDGGILEFLPLYRKLSIECISNSLHIQEQTQEQLSDAALANKDDFEMKEKKWTDKDGKKHSSVEFDYGYGEERKANLNK